MGPNANNGVLPGFASEIERLRIEAMQRIDSIPIAVLIWGPAPNSANGDVRLQLRDEIARRGHLANFSEDLIDHTSSHSVLVQQVAHAEAHDIVFSIPSTPGSIAEVHDFARIPRLSHKVVAFLNQEWNDGYSNQSLLQIQSNMALSNNFALLNVQLPPRKYPLVQKDCQHG